MYFLFSPRMLRRAALGLIAVLLAGSSLSAPPILLAQGPPEPIALGQNKPGEISAANPQPAFLFTATAGQSVIVEVLGLTDGLAPQLTIQTASNALVQAFGNPTLGSSLSATITFPQAGDYVLQVSGVNGAVGQFALRIAAAAPAEPPTPLAVGQPATGTLAPGEQAAFSFSTPAEASLLLSLATNGLQGLTAEISDPSGTILGTLGSALAGGAFGLPPLVSDYTLVLRHDQPNLPPVGFTLLLGANGSTPSAVQGPAATEEVTLPDLPSSGPCVLATAGSVNVNVRQMPSLDGPQVGALTPQQIVSVVGRNADGFWFQIEDGGLRGWVAGSVTRLGGDCTSLPVTFVPEPTASAPIAGDNEQRGVEIPYRRGTSVGFSGQISYPQGDTQDTVSYRWTETPTPFPSGSDRPQFRYSVRCTGDGVENAIIEFDDGSSQACTPEGSNFTVLAGDNSQNAGSITVRLTGGNNAYVTWSMQFSWYIP